MKSLQKLLTIGSSARWALGLACFVVAATSAVQAQSNDPSTDSPSDYEKFSRLVYDDSHSSKDQRGPASPFSSLKFQIEVMKYFVYGLNKPADIKSVVIASKNPDAQALVDRLALKMFKSKPARKMFCKVTDSVPSAQKIFSVTKSAAEEIISVCRKLNEPIIAFDISKSKPSREIVLVETATPSRIESWTSERGDIYIFHTGQMDENDLLRSLVHEYYIALDSKSLFNYATRNGFRMYQEIKVRGDREAYYDLLETLMYPTVRGAFQLVRAYYFEYKVLQDLMGSKRAPTDPDCWGHVRRVATIVHEMPELYIPHFFYAFSPDYYTTLLSKMPGLEIYEQMRELERRADLKPTLCNELRKATIGTSFVDLTSGPRPRIGSGTEKKGQLRLKEKALSIEQLKARSPLNFDFSTKSQTLDLTKLKTTPVDPLRPLGTYPDVYKTWGFPQ